MTEASTTAATNANSAVGFSHRHRLRVRYAETDTMGVVYYGNYLRYFEIARNELLRRAGATYRTFEETHGLMLPVVEAATVRVPVVGTVRSLSRW